MILINLFYLQTKKKVPRKSIFLNFSINEPGGVGILTYNAIKMAANTQIGTLMKKAILHLYIIFIMI